MTKGAAGVGVELIERARAGDESALGEIYDRHARDVQGFLCSLGLRLRPSEIEDLVQETFLRLFRELERFDSARPLRPYVLGIARYAALNLFRQRRSSSNLVDELTPSDEVLKAVSRSERQGLIQQALAALDPEQQAVLSLRHNQELTMQELADSLACSVPTARTRLRGAASRFAVELIKLGLLPGEGAQ